MSTKTVKVRIKASLASPSLSCQPGDVVDWPAEDARRLIDAGYAEPAPQEKEGREKAAKKSAGGEEESA